MRLTLKLIIHCLSYTDLTSTLLLLRYCQKFPNWPEFIKIISPIFPFIPSASIHIMYCERKIQLNCNCSHWVTSPLSEMSMIRGYSLILAVPLERSFSKTENPPSSPPASQKERWDYIQQIQLLQTNSKDRTDISYYYDTTVLLHYLRTEFVWNREM